MARIQALTRAASGARPQETPVKYPRLSRHLDEIIIALDQVPKRPRRDVLKVLKRIAEAAAGCPRLDNRGWRV